MDGTKVGNGMVVVGKILYFDAPIPEDIIRQSLQAAIRRYTEEKLDEDPEFQNWEVKYKISKRLSKDHEHIYTLVLFESNDDYMKFLPRNRTERITTKKILTAHEEEEVRKLEDHIDQLIQEGKAWEANNLEEDLERLLNDEEFISYQLADCPIPNLSFDNFSKRELAAIRHVRCEMLDEVNKIVKIKPEVCYYYEPGPQYSKTAISANSNFRPDLEEIRNAFRLCCSADTEHYPKVHIQKRGTKWRTVVNFAPYTSDAITALAFLRDFNCQDKGPIRFTYLYGAK